MGMYTGLRFRGIVKPEFIESIAKIHSYEAEWSDLEDETLRDFGRLSRAGFIPHGSLSYMPSSWIDVFGRSTDGFAKEFDKETGYWTFQCSLKNYSGEIDEFIEILPHFMSEVEHCEKFYEEWDWSELYALVDGGVTLITENYRNYTVEDNYHDRLMEMQRRENNIANDEGDVFEW